MNTRRSSPFAAPIPRSTRQRCILATLGFVLPLVVSAQLVVYSFGPAASPTPAPTFTAENVSAGWFTGNLGSPTTGAGNPLFAAGSGGGYFSASNWGSPSPGTNYFEFTLTPAAGYGFTVESVAFAYRATSSGPTSFAVRSSIDNFGSDLANGTFTADSSWYSTESLPLELAPQDEATTFRLYASGASSNLGTLRIDDLALAGNVSAIPEPSTWGGMVGACALALALWRKRSRCRLPSPGSA